MGAKPLQDGFVLDPDVGAEIRQTRLAEAVCRRCRRVPRCRFTVLVEWVQTRFAKGGSLKCRWLSTSTFPDGDEDFREHFYVYLPRRRRRLFARGPESLPKDWRRRRTGMWVPQDGHRKLLARVYGSQPTATASGALRCITSPTIAEWTSIKKIGESKLFWPSVVTQRVFDEKDESPRYIADVVGGNVRFDKRDELHFHDWLRDSYGEGEPFEEIKRRFRSVLPRDELPVYESCAVVGSAPDLLAYKDGAEIDSFSAVIRTNSAFTEGFEEYVGRKITFATSHCCAASLPNVFSSSRKIHFNNILYTSIIY